jgi:hypothetical protein
MWSDKVSFASAKICLGAVFFAAPGCSTEQGKLNMSQQPAHPGEIRMVDAFDKCGRVVSSAQFPDRQRFVMLDREGIETSNPQLAVQHVPIVLARIFRLDAKGELVPADRTTQIRILEYGLDDRLLRSTTMPKDK